MGAFFTNVQLRKGPDVSVDTIESILDSVARTAGMRRCSEGQTADRTIAVRHGPGDWVSVYDEATEGQDTKLLDGLAEALSAGTNSHAVAVLVHDSDVLRLALFARGERVDRVDSNPGYFSGKEPSKKARREAAGHPARWKDVLAADADPFTLSAVWSEEKLFAEDTLARTSALLGCAAERTSIGYRYLEPDTVPEGELTLLRYAYAQRPAYEAEEDGPPRFHTDLPPEYAQRVVPHTLAVGDELRVSVTCRNAGGPGKGLSIRVWGEAIDAGLVKLDRFELLIGNVRANARHVMITPEVTDHEGHPVWLHDGDHVIPAGVRGGLAALAGVRDPSVMMDLMYKAQVHVNVVGSLEKAGQGKLFVALFPSEVGSDAAFATIHELHVDAPLYRPLHARELPGPFGDSHIVRPLSERDALVAMVVYGGSQQDASRHAAGAFERFAAACPPIQQYDKGIFQANPSRRPKSGSVKAKGLFGSKRWKNLVESMESERQVTLSPPFDLAALADAGPTPKREGHGFAFGRSILPPPTAEGDDEVTVLALWARVEGMEPDRVQALRKLAYGIVEEVMAEQGGLQGLVTRWGQQSHSVDSTPYEQACGIHGPITMLRSWVTRWLRAVGNDALWLGRDLRARLHRSDVCALREIADVGDAGTALRIVLQDGGDESVIRLETILQSLLPSMNDAQQLQMKLYRGRDG